MEQTREPTPATVKTRAQKQVDGPGVSAVSEPVGCCVLLFPAASCIWSARKKSVGGVGGGGGEERC